MASGVFLAAVLVSTGTNGSQEPASERDAGTSSVRSPADEKQTRTSAPRSDPDALRFAYGLLRQRKYDLAAEEFERFIKAGAAGRALSDARIGLANARLYQARYRDARRQFEEFLSAARDDPRAPTARYRLGEMSYILGDLPSARRSLEAFTATKANHPGLEMAWSYLGDTYFGLKDLAQARLAYERSLSAFPQGRLADRARYGLGRTLAAMGRKEEALKLLEELAAQGGPEWVDRAWLQVGLIQHSAGRFAEAARAFASLERAAPRSPLRPEAQLHRALALSRLGRIEDAEGILKPLAVDGPPSLAAQAALEMATIELEQKRPDAALRTVDEALKRFPKSPSAPALLFRSGEALQRLNRLTEAQARFLRVAEGDPDDPWADDALQRACQAALDRGDTDAARRLAGSFAKRFPKSALFASVRLIEARAASSQGRPREAATILESLLAMPEQKPRETGPSLPPELVPAIRYELALAYRGLGRAAESEAILSSLAKGPTGPVAADARFLVGQAHVTAGRYALAITPLEQYLAASPQGDVADFALAHLAVARMALGRLDDAWKALDELARRFPRSKALARTRVRLGEAALSAHQIERAAELFRSVVAASAPAGDQTKGPEGVPSAELEMPIRVRALSGLGSALLELGKPAEAAATFAALLDVAPRDPIAPQVALARGRALEANREQDAAISAYAKVVESFAESDQAPLAAVARARLLAKLGRHEEAAQAFERVIGDRRALASLSKAGLSTDALVADWGWALLDAHKTAEADRVFSRLLKEHATSPYADDARFNLAESANQARNYAEVIRLLTPLAAARPAQGRPSSPDTERDRASVTDAERADRSKRLLPAALYRLGRTQLELKDWNAALRTLDRLLKEFPENPYRREARFVRALAALRHGDAVTAEADFAALLAEPAGKTDPQGLLHAVRLRQIECWVSLRRWNEVIKAAKALTRELAEHDPARAELDYAQGQALLGLARMQEARQAFQAVVDARRGGELAAQAQLMRGETFFHEDQLHEALREFLKVDILYEAPTWQAAALLEAGKVYERLDQWADAAETYDRLLSRFPGEPSTAEARQRLDAAKQRTASTANSKKS